MIEPVILGYIALTLISIVVSALFSGIETGVYTLNRVRLVVRAGRGDSRARILRDELQHPNRLLTTLLIGNNIVNYAGSYGVAAILEHMHVGAGQAVLINAAVLIPLLFVLSEVLPKDLFRSNTDRWTYRCAAPLRAARQVLTAVGLVPLVTGFGELTTRLLRQAPPGTLPARERIAQLMLEGVGAGVLSETQAGLLDRTMVLRDRTAASAMVPWRRVVTVPADAAGPARQANFSNIRADDRVVVIDEKGKPLGAAQALRLLLEPGQRARDLMDPVVMIEANTPVPTALRMIRAVPHATGIVTEARSGRPLGLVTAHDLLEPLTGESGARP